jgi:hypothetical protein
MAHPISHELGGTMFPGSKLQMKRMVIKPWKKMSTAKDLIHMHLVAAFIRSISRIMHP